MRLINYWSNMDMDTIKETQLFTIKFIKLYIKQCCLIV